MWRPPQGGARAFHWKEMREMSKSRVEKQTRDVAGDVDSPAGGGKETLGPQNLQMFPVCFNSFGYQLLGTAEDRLRVTTLASS